MGVVFPERLYIVVASVCKNVLRKHVFFGRGPARVATARTSGWKVSHEIVFRWAARDVEAVRGDFGRNFTGAERKWLLGAAEASAGAQGRRRAIGEERRTAPTKKNAPVAGVERGLFVRFWRRCLLSGDYAD